MDSGSDYKVEFCKIPRTILYEDSQGTIRFGFDGNTAQGRNILILERRLETTRKAPSAEGTSSNEVSQSRLDMAFERTKQYLVSRGYRVKVWPDEFWHRVVNNTVKPVQPTRRKFPRLRPDGSFCIEFMVRVRASELQALASRVAEWLDAWVREHRYLRRSFPREKGQELVDFFDELAGVPSCVACPPGSLRLRFNGLPGAYWWRDYYVLMLTGMRAAFPEVSSMERPVNCPDAL
jgi:hypothetical protein